MKWYGPFICNVFDWCWLNRKRLPRQAHAVQLTPTKLLRRAIDKIHCFWRFQFVFYLFTMTLPPPQLTDRDRFRLDCQNHMDGRLNGGYITGQGARLLRKALLTYMNENKHDRRDLDELMVEALDQCPVRRITPKILQRYRLIAVPIAPKQLYPDSRLGTSTGTTRCFANARTRGNHKYWFCGNQLGSRPRTCEVKSARPAQGCSQRTPW